MPRHARVRLADCPWHVWQRGVNRSACFADDLDRQRYLGLLKDHAAHHGCDIHAYVLMTNHVHLLITPRSEHGLSHAMKAVNERYVPFFNRRHGRTGTLWEGRFRSNLVQSETYLFVCQTYIELNPVRADMVRHPAQHPWSSYLANASGAPSGLVTPHERYLALAPTAEQRARAYQALAEAPLSLKQLDQIRKAIAVGYALGDAAFTKDLEARKGIPVTRRKPGRKRRSAEKQNGAECSAPRE
jgi:putative transposase